MDLRRTNTLRRALSRVLVFSLLVSIVGPGISPAQALVAAFQATQTVANVAAGTDAQALVAVTTVANAAAGADDTQSATTAVATPSAGSVVAGLASVTGYPNHAFSSSGASTVLVTHTGVPVNGSPSAQEDLNGDGTANDDIAQVSSMTLTGGEEIVSASASAVMQTTPGDGEFLSIGGCTVTFDSSYLSDDLDCSDFSAGINPYSPNPPFDPYTPTEMAAVLASLQYVSNLTGSVVGSTATFTSTSGANNVNIGGSAAPNFIISATPRNSGVQSVVGFSFTGDLPAGSRLLFNGFDWIYFTGSTTDTDFSDGAVSVSRFLSPVAQVTTVTLSGAVEAGDVFTANLPGPVAASFTSTGTSADDAAAGLDAAIKASAGYGAQPFTSSVAANVVTLTAKVPGAAAFTVTSSATNRPATAQVATFTPSDVEAGDVFSGSINGTPYAFTATAATVQNVVEGLQPLMDANAAVTCTEDDLKVTCTADAPGTAFAIGSSVTNRAAVSQQVTFVPNSIVYEGMRYRATVNGNNYDYVTLAGDDESDIASALHPLMNADPSVTCVLTDVDEVTCLADAAGTSFTYSTSITDVTAPSISITNDASATWTNSDVIATSSSDNSPSPLTVKYVVQTGATCGTGSDADLDAGTLATSLTAADESTYGGKRVCFRVTDGAGLTAYALSAVIDHLDTVAPVVTLSGSTPMRVVTGSGYAEPGALWTDNHDGSGAVSTISGSVNDAATGSYTLTYLKADAAGNTGSTTRVVNVTDGSGPTVTLVGSGTQYVEFGSAYVELGATWADVQDGTGTVSTISGSVNTGALGSYPLTYTQVDNDGNDDSATRTVVVRDTTAPTVTLNGSSTGSVERFGSYVESGATWSDLHDGTGAVATISGSVDISAVGAYVLTYLKTDVSGNTGSTVRTVTVQDTVGPTVGAVSVTPNAAGTGATYAYTTNETATGVLYVGTGADVSATLVTSSTTYGSGAHAGSLTGLTSGVLYSYYVTATDASSNATSTATGTFNTVDNDVPSVSAKRVSGVSATGATVSFDFTDAHFTAGVGTGSVTVGTGASYVSAGTGATTVATGSVNVGTSVFTSLTADTAYNYRVTVVDDYGNTATSVGTFITASAPVALTGGTVSSTGATSMTGTSVGNGGSVALSGTIVIVHTDLADTDALTGSLTMSGVTALTVSGSSWNGVILPPSLVQSGSTENASSGELLPVLPSNTSTTTYTSTILQTVKAGAEGTSLVASGGTFTLSFLVPSGTVGDTVYLYRSTDGSAWEANSPDASCVLDAGKMCTFSTNHLSFFSAVRTTSSTVAQASGGGGGRGAMMSNAQAEVLASSVTARALSFAEQVRQAIAQSDRVQMKVGKRYLTVLVPRFSDPATNVRVAAAANAVLRKLDAKGLSDARMNSAVGALNAYLVALKAYSEGRDPRAQQLALAAVDQLRKALSGSK